MFQMYINVEKEGLSSYKGLFADAAKLLRVIRKQDDCMELQRDINKNYDWSQGWKSEFNAKKCHVLEMGKSSRRPTYNCKMGQELIMKRKKEKDLGVIIQANFLPERHLNGTFVTT